MKRLLTVCFAILLLAPGFSGCKKCDCPGPGTTTTTTTEDVVLQNTLFSPSEKTITKGTTVRWTNHDPYAHTVTSTTNVFDSGNLDQGATFEFTFNATGTYDYYCKYHSSIMRGKIIVN